LPGTEGEGVADVLFSRGDAQGFDFTGRLSFSWPATALPVSFDATDRVHGAQFAYGYGLDYAHAAQLAALPTDSGVPHAKNPAAELYGAGHVIAPWSIFVADKLASVHMTTPSRASPQGAVVARKVDAGVRIDWRGDGSGLFWISGRPQDFRERAAAGLQVVIRYRVLTAPAATVHVGVRCSAPYNRDRPPAIVAGSPPAPSVELCGTASGAMLDVTPELRAAATRGWQELAIPLHCLAERGAALADVEVPLAIETAGRLALEIAAADFRAGVPTGSCPRGT
jgi:beta-glucosidase